MARAARQKGGVAYLQCVSIRDVSATRFDSRRLTKKLPANSHPPPSVGCAALRRHLPPSGWTIAIASAGGGGSAEWGQAAGGVAYLQRVSVRGVSPRSSQLTRTRPPPSAALRYAATSPLRGGGLLLPWRGELGPRSGASQRGASRICNAFRFEASHQEAPS